MTEAIEEIDLLDQLACKHISLYEGLGFVEIVDMMPRRVPLHHSADLAISRNARISYSQFDTPTVANSERLVRYLTENWHTSPSESVVFQFRARVPIYVSRHIDRHRTARSNYESGRYIEMPANYHLPALRMQSKSNKQGSQEAKGSQPEPEIPLPALSLWNDCHGLIQTIFLNYKSLLSMGVAKEVARCILPQGLMTSFTWQMDLKNLLHFIRLRTDSHAQLETRQFADAILELITPLVPVSIRAFNDFQVNQVSFDVAEQKHLVGGEELGARKQNQLQEKLNALGLTRASQES